MREKKKKTTERRRGPHFREKTRTDYDDDETLPRESMCSKQQHVSKKKFLEREEVMMMKIPRSVHRPQR